MIIIIREMIINDSTLDYFISELSAETNSVLPSDKPRDQRRDQFFSELSATVLWHSNQSAAPSLSQRH